MRVKVVERRNSNALSMSFPSEKMYQDIEINNQYHSIICYQLLYLL